MRKQNRKLPSIQVVLTLLGVAFAGIAASPVVDNWLNGPKGHKLSLSFSEWEIPFSSGKVINPPQPIQTGVPTTLRFALHDENKRHPLIRHVYLTLPSSAEVAPGTDSGRVWTQANSHEPDKLKYFCLLDYRVPVGESGQFLPPINVSFRTPGKIPIGYAIVADDIDKPRIIETTIAIGLQESVGLEQPSPQPPSEGVVTPVVDASPEQKRLRY